MRQRIPARKRRGCREPKFALGGETCLEWRRYAAAEDTGLDASKALTNDPATAGIAVVACTGWSQKNARRRQQDVACAFLDIAELGLDEGREALLVRWSALCAG